MKEVLVPGAWCTPREGLGANSFGKRRVFVCNGAGGVLTLLVLTPQTLCETLHTENKELRTKLERDLEQRNQALEKLR